MTRTWREREKAARGKNKNMVLKVEDKGSEKPKGVERNREI